MTFGREEHVWIPESDLEGMSVDTLAVRAGQIRTGQLEHSDAIFPTSSFVYGSAAQALPVLAVKSPVISTPGLPTRRFRHLKPELLPWRGESVVLRLLQVWLPFSAPACLC